MHTLLNIFDAASLVRYGGLVLIFFLIYGSTGLFFCFFIPSGAVLFAAGMLTANGEMGYGLFMVCLVLILASILGNITGYWFGAKTGALLYKRSDSRFFKQQHLKTAELFYKKYGSFALTLGLYLPIVRTFAGIVAGLVGMNFNRFLLLTTAGSIASVLSFVIPGYMIGTMPVLKKYTVYIIFIFLIIITVPLIIRVLREYNKLKKENAEQ